MRHAGSVAVVLLWLVALPIAAQQPTPRNFIVILADDLGVECLGCYGGPYATPALDELAEQGMRFSECHTQPLCTPTRLELLTGKSNARNYVAFSVLPPTERTVAHLLKDAGYATGVFGKWQLYATDSYPEGIRGTGTLPEQAGFDSHCVWQVEVQGSRYWQPTLRIAGEDREFSADTYGPDVCADHLLGFIEANRESRFFAFWPMMLTHGPFAPPPPATDDRSPAPRHFGAMVSYMDGLVGRVVRRIDELGLSDRTLVVFVGDNGTNRSIRTRQGDRTVRGGKGTTTDAGTHVPMIAWAPGLVSPGTTTDELVCTRDLLPTLAGLAGVKPPDDLDGQSLTPLLRSEASFRRDALAFWYWPRPLTRPQSRAVRFALDRRFKLYDDGRMFDRRDDPLEEAPLQGDDDEERAESRSRLRAALDALPARPEK